MGHSKTRCLRPEYLLEKDSALYLEIQQLKQRIASFPGQLPLPPSVEDVFAQLVKDGRIEPHLDYMDLVRANLRSPDDPHPSFVLACDTYHAIHRDYEERHARWRNEHPAYIELRGSLEKLRLRAAEATGTVLVCQDVVTLE
jgi:hypothetical protein